MCVCVCVRVHTHVRMCAHVWVDMYMWVCHMSVCVQRGEGCNLLNFGFIKDEHTLSYWLWFVNLQAVLLIISPSIHLILLADECWH